MAQGPRPHRGLCRLQPERPRPHHRQCLLGPRRAGDDRFHPITWDEIDEVDLRQFTIATVPARFARLGDLHQGIDDSTYPLDTLLDWTDRDGLD